MDSATRRALRIHAICHGAEDVLLFDLRSPQAGDLPAFAPGAHVDVHLPAGLVRSYSLLNDAIERHRYVIGVKRAQAGRGGSAWLHAAPRVGDRLEVGSPRNNFALQDQAPHSVFVAGGIGITPLWSMIQRLRSLQRPWSLHYRSRSRASAALLEEVSGAAGSGSVHTSFREDGDPRLDLAAIVGQAPAGAHFYCCGPAPMLQDFEVACAGLEPARVHVEYFAPREGAATAGGFTVRLARSGRSVHVLPGRTILEAVEGCGVDVPFSCREGVCGACETRVLRGVPDHRDQVLSDAERAAGRSMLVCCSGALSDEIELDL